MSRPAGFLALLATATVVACGPDDQAPAEAPSSARADSVALAMQTFDETVFDTIAWESDEVRAERGALVYNISCSKCHGPNGEGDAGFVMQGDTLRPPSFQQPQWGFAQAPLQLRRYIFSGNVAGMPYWGLVGLKYRDIDAVAYFLEGPLRARTGAP